MSKESNALYSGLKLAAILAAAVVATGCLNTESAKSRAAAALAAATPATPLVSIPEPIPPMSSWIVSTGEHLWGIAGIWEVFNVPEKWPLLYKANLDQIKDADLIYPGQILDIPRDSSVSEIDAAIKHAKQRGTWAVGSVEISDEQYLKNSP